MPNLPLKLIIQSLPRPHSSVERACLLGAVKCHQVTSDENECMRGDALAAAIAEDKAKGLIPFYVSTLHKSVAVPEIINCFSFNCRQI